MDIRIAQPISSSKSQYSRQGNSELRRACQDFESVFTMYLLKSMRRTVQKVNTTEYGRLSNDVYMSMMDAEIAKAVSSGQGIGLAEMLYRQLSQTKKA